MNLFNPGLRSEEAAIFKVALLPQLHPWLPTIGELDADIPELVST